MHRNLPEKHVITCFLESDNEILLLQRSQQVGSYQGKWAGVSGYVETTPDEQALIEIQEETSLQLADLELLKKGEPLFVEDEDLGVGVCEKGFTDAGFDVIDTVAEFAEEAHLGGDNDLGGIDCGAGESARCCVVEVSHELGGGLAAAVAVGLEPVLQSAF